MTEIDRQWLDAYPLPPLEAATDKNARGQVLVAGGSRTVPGGLRLTGEAALRAGAGKVQFATVECAAIGLGLVMPEAASFGLPENLDGELGAAAGFPLVGLVAAADAFVFGPAMGHKSEPQVILDRLCDNAPRDATIVLDAAAIQAAPWLARSPRAWQRGRILTPHFGEMGRLMSCAEDTVGRESARAAAQRYGAIVVLKGPETWIAAPDGAMLRYPGGGAGLATGGSGDVLAGIIGGLAARGCDPLVAAGWGVWLHGEAGRRLAVRTGPVGFLARELLPELPSLMAATAP